MAAERKDINVRAQIIITRALPGTEPIKAPTTIWWHGSRFHVHVESGLPAQDLLALANSPRGFGREPRTKEEFMDTRTELPGVTDVYGDLTKRSGTVVTDGTKLAADIELLLPMAELVLSGDLTGLERTGSAKLLGRDATEYTSYLSGRRGVGSKVRRLVAGPYTLLREVTDERRRGALLRVEVLSIEEGAGSDVDAPA